MRRNWRSQFNVETGCPVLVLGNGPSLVEEESLRLWDEFASSWGSVIGCNLAWNLARKHGIDQPDYLVTFDKQQAHLALEHTDIQQILSPYRPGSQFQVPDETVDRYGDRLVFINPYGEKWPREDDVKVWRPDRSPGYGHLSGLMAFQWAMMLGARTIYLLGMDLGGIQSGDRVALSAFDSTWPGYAFTQIGPRSCRDVGWVKQPLGWLRTQELWWQFTARAEELGYEVYRLADTGAMVWLKTQTPDAEQPASSEQLPSDR